MSTTTFEQVAQQQEPDFGWSRPAYLAPWLIAAVLVSAALGLQLHWPECWGAWFVLALLGAGFFAGGVWLRTSDKADHAPLPLVDWLGSDGDLVLDAGCGGGRTTLAVAKVLRRGRIVALDRFDARYIEAGGRALLERNLRIAGLTGRVEIAPGDITRLPFPDGQFDSAVSAHVMDHLGPNKRTGLAELRRVLKPGGRLLMVNWVPGWAMFSLGNVFSFLLTSPAGWGELAAAAGFAIRDQGRFNGLWFAVLERPR